MTAVGLPRWSIAAVQPDASAQGRLTLAAPAAVPRSVPAIRIAPAWLCLIVGLLGTLPLVLITPPLQVPDEGQHFARAYQISELHLWSEIRDGKVGADLPASLSAFLVRFLGTTDERPDRTIRPMPLAATLDARSQVLAPERRAFLGFVGAAFYAPLPYVPQAIAIAIARAFGSSPLDLLYAGRLANALTALALLVAAVRLAPIGKATFVVVGLLPMALYQYASVSPDAMVIGCAFVFTALALRAQGRGCWTWRAITAATLAGIVFCSLKPVYAPLLIAGLVPDILRKGQWAAALRAHAFIVGAVGLATWLWMRSTASVFVLARPGTSVSGQWAFLRDDPLAYPHILATTLRAHGLLYYESTVGVFGWVKILAMPVFYGLPIVTALLLCGSVERNNDTRAVEAIAAVWHAALAAACGLLVLTALYFIWTPIGAASIEGVQGRYFLPALALAGVGVFRLLPPVVPGLKPLLMPLLAALLALEIAMTDLVIAGAYSIV